MGNIDKSAPVYPIGIVQNLTGLSGRQIRYYEQQGLVEPERTKGNQRLYSPNDVDRLVRIKQLLEEGLTLEGVKAKLTSLEEPYKESAPKTNAPPIDHDSVIPQLQDGAQLASLYPVRNQAALTRLLEARRAAQNKPKQ